MNIFLEPAATTVGSFFDGLDVYLCTAKRSSMSTVDLSDLSEKMSPGCVYYIYKIIYPIM